MNRLAESAIKSGRSLYNTLPVLAGVILLIGLINTLVPKSLYRSVFTGNEILNSLIGSGLGSLMAGNPVTSYILGGEMLKQGVGLMAVTSFIVAWVTVGMVQLPAESLLLGKRFAILRNLICFIFSILVAGLTVMILGAM